MLASLIANGYLATQWYTDSVQDVIRSKAVFVSGRMSADKASTFEWNFFPSCGSTAISATTPDADLTACVNEVIAKLQSRVSGHGTNIPVSISEAKGTIGMIGDAVVKLSTAYRQVRKGRFKSAAQTLGLRSTPKGLSLRKSAERNWLQYRYGWRLVVYDIESLTKTLYDQLTTRPILLRVTAKAERHRKATQVTNLVRFDNPYSGATLFTVTVTKNIVTDQVCRGGYVYEISNTALAGAQSFGLANPFVWAWEVIPYSFVLDWVVNVGSVLEGLTAFVGKIYKDGWICKEAQTTTTVSWSNVAKGWGAYTLTKMPSFFSDDVIERRFARSRQNFTSATIHVDFDLNVQRVMDAISLVDTRPKKKLPFWL